MLVILYVDILSVLGCIHMSRLSGVCLPDVTVVCYCCLWQASKSDRWSQIPPRETIKRIMSGQVSYQLLTAAGLLQVVSSMFTLVQEKCNSFLMFLYMWEKN